MPKTKGDLPEVEDEEFEDDDAELGTVLNPLLMSADEWRTYVESAIHDAYVEAGYIKPNGEKDRNAVGTVCLGCLKHAVAHGLDEREDNAVTHGKVVAKAFPNLPGPTKWATMEQPILAETVYDRISGNIGTMMKMDVSGLVQKKVGSTGMVLCHTYVTDDQVLAYYITDDLECIMEDFDSPHKHKLVKAAKSYGKNLAMVTARLPQHAGELAKGYKRTMRQALQSGNVELAPALEATSVSDESADETNAK